MLRCSRASSQEAGGYGCSHERVLSIDQATDVPLTGVEKYEVSLETQTAEVVTKDDSLEYNTVLTTIAKTGKKVKSGQADGKDMPVEIPSAESVLYRG